MKWETVIYVGVVPLGLSLIGIAAGSKLDGRTLQVADQQVAARGINGRLGGRFMNVDGVGAVEQFTEARVDCACRFAVDRQAI